LYPTQIVIGAAAACALLNNGTVYCWGQAGQLGDGSETESHAPVKVSGISTAIQITNGANTPCALLANGTVRCWGTDLNGQITGTPVSGNQLTPEAVPGLTGAKEIQSGVNSSCALLSNGSVRCWGMNSDSQTISQTRTVLTGATHLGNGDMYTACAVMADASVQCWTGADGTPSKLTGLANVTQQSFTCALSSDGSVRCWGSGSYGQIGNGMLDFQASPTLVQQLGTATQIASGGSHVCAILSDKTLSCWGKDSFFGMLDYGPLPLQIGGLTNVVNVSASASNTCVVTSDHKAYCWGFNLWGQLGDGTTDNQGSPVEVKGLPTGG
jgi:alpha-tubulin suppressor-like RCC1 family protein